MTSEEIISLVGCRSCDARRGQPCQGLGFFVETLHDIRRQDAVKRREISREPNPSFIQRGRDCAWCGKTDVASPRYRAGISWNLCLTCASNRDVQQAMDMQGDRERRRKVERGKASGVEFKTTAVSYYPEQSYLAYLPPEPPLTVGDVMQLKPLVGTWNPRLVSGYLVEGTDWPWAGPDTAGPLCYVLSQRKLWVATIALDKDSPGGLSRDFWPRGRGAFVAAIPKYPLDPVEVSADLRDGTLRLRWFGVLQEVKADHAYFLSAPSAVEAINLSEQMRNPQLQLKRPERRFNFE